VPEIQLDLLSKSFGRGPDVVADLCLSIPAGEFLTVVGPSGSGKTTLLRMLAGLETPTRGTIRFGGRRVDHLPPKDREVAVVFQNPAPYPHLNARENIAFSLRARRTDRAEVRRRVEGAAEFLGITGLLSRRPDQLSGGERQRVVLARAIARRPELLLLDEPLTGLDAPLREDVRRILSSIHREHSMTILMVTHDQGDALALGDRVAVLHRGVLQQCDAPEVLYDRPKTEFVARFIGDPPMTVFPVKCDKSLPPNVPATPPVHVGFRPEAMRLGDDQEVFGLPATIERVEHAGRDQVVWLRSGTQKLALRIPATRKPAVGDRVTVYFDASAAYYFDPSSGLALSGPANAPGDPAHAASH
jgi:ABC-type sugar transport system ATPase subunit